MKTILLEGMSTSGKTTLKTKLAEKLKSLGVQYRELTENETFWPCLSSDPKLSIEHFKKLIREISAEDEKVLILDRSYFTHILVTNSTIDQYKEVEQMLLKLNPLLVCLTILDKKIPERIFGAVEHRGDSWREHVASKGEREDAVEWFKKTQRGLLKLYNETKLPKVKFDTTDQDYDRICAEIVEKYLNLK